MQHITRFILAIWLGTAGGATSLYGADITGTILDCETMRPLAGATAYIPAISAGAIASADGTFNLIVPEPGTYQLTVSFVGYKHAAFDAVVPGDGTATFTVQLSPEPFIAESVVITAAKNRRRIVDTVETIDVVSSDDLARTNASAITDALRNVPGVSLNHGPNPDRERPEIRGMGGERVLLSVDGAKMNLSTMNIGDTHVLADDIARIEVVKGPSSALYGSSAMGGVINIITREPREMLEAGRQFGARLTYTHNGLNAGSTENLQFYGIVGARFDWKASFTRRDSRYLTLDENDSSKLDRGKDATGDNIRLDGIYRIGRDNTVKLQYERYFYNPVTEPGAMEPDPSGLFYNYQEREYLRDLRQAIYTIDTPGGIFTGIEMRGYRQMTEVTDRDDERTDIEGFPPVREILRERDNNTLTTWGGEIKATALAVTGTAHHVITAGVEFMYDDYHQVVRGTRSLYEPNDGGNGFEEEPSQVEPVVEARSPDTEYTIWSAYLQDEVYWGDHIILIPGARLDSYRAGADRNTAGYDDSVITEASSNETAVSPKFGIVGKLTDTQSLTLNIGRGFRVPSKGELYYAFNMADIFYIVPNPELKPESCINYELSHKLQNATVTGGTSIFYTRYSDFIGGRYLSPAPGTVLMRYQYINKDRVDMWGIESSYRLSLPHAVSLDTGLTWHRGEYADTGSRVEGLNKPKITLGIECAPRIGPVELAFSLSGRYVGPMDYYESIESDTGEETTRLAEYDGYGICDLGTSVTVGGRYRANLYINNLFDRQYQEFSSLLLPAPGRYATISASITY